MRIGHARGPSQKKSAILTDVGYIYPYIPLDADSEDSEPDIVQLSTYVAPPTRLVSSFKKSVGQIFWIAEYERASPLSLFLPQSANRHVQETFVSLDEALSSLST